MNNTKMQFESPNKNNNNNKQQLLLLAANQDIKTTKLGRLLVGLLKVAALFTFLGLYNQLVTYQIESRLADGLSRLQVRSPSAENELATMAVAVAGSSKTTGSSSESELVRRVLASLRQQQLVDQLARQTGNFSSARRRRKRETDENDATTTMTRRLKSTLGEDQEEADERDEEEDQEQEQEEEQEEAEDALDEGQGIGDWLYDYLTGNGRLVASTTTTTTTTTTPPPSREGKQTRRRRKWPANLNSQPSCLCPPGEFVLSAR